MREYIARRFPLNLQLFAEDPNNNPDPNPNPNPDPDPNKGKTFTQAELDAAVQSRLSRAEKDAKKALAKELGFDSVEAMQAAMKKDKGSDKRIHLILQKSRNCSTSESRSARRNRTRRPSIAC